MSWSADWARRRRQRWVGRWGWTRAGVGAAAVSAATAAIERIGTTTGLPFGRYRYTGRLRPAVAGVPAVVPLAWWSMAVPAREVANAALGSRSTPPGRIVLGAVALTAWDLFLDPQMTAEGYWRWTARRRVPRHPAEQLRRLAVDRGRP